ncbi:MAG TPA: gamma-glutamyl-gamma-aminobutyrate hydrolase family protein [Streptosporangiaceae bacterium]|jgi:putative glutamine amidotransferase
MPDGDRPVVGIFASTEVLDGVGHHAVRDAYVRAVTGVAGCAAVVLPVGTLGPEPVRRLDGILLTGHESDVQPELYGGPPGHGLADPGRDEAALEVIRLAVAGGVPLLGICRGIQELNVAYGGTLRDLPRARPGDVGHREDLTLPRDEQYLPQHPVAIAEGGALHSILRAGRAWVNSLHGQAIDTLASALRPEATAADGVIEAASVAGARALALGVQWHPEWHAATDPVCRRIFEAFGAACHAYATGRPREAAALTSGIPATALASIPAARAGSMAGGRPLSGAD